MRLFRLFTSWLKTIPEVFQPYSLALIFLISCHANFYAEVIPGQETNAPPVISALSDVTTFRNTNTSTISFTISDVDNSLACSGSLSMSSSDPSKVANTSVAWAGTAPNCTAIITPEPNAIGSLNLTFSVFDGASRASSIFTLNIETKDLDPTWTPHFDKLDAYWSFRGAAGADITNGTMINAIIGDNLIYKNPMNLLYPDSGYTSAPTNQGVLLSQNFITGPGAYAYPQTENFTFITWIKFTSVSDWSKVFSNSHALNGDSGFSIQINPQITGTKYPGTFAIGLGGNGNLLSNAVGLRTIGGTYNDGQWHHLAVVFNQISRVINVYIDGAPEFVEMYPGTCGTVSANTNVDFSSCPDAQNIVAGWVESTISGWSGSDWQSLESKSALAEMAIFNVALTEGEVQLIFNRQK